MPNQLVLRIDSDGKKTLYESENDRDHLPSLMTTKKGKFFLNRNEPRRLLKKYDEIIKSIHPAAPIEEQFRTLAVYEEIKYPMCFNDDSISKIGSIKD